MGMVLRTVVLASTVREWEWEVDAVEWMEVESSCCVSAEGVWVAVQGFSWWF